MSSSHYISLSDFHKIKRMPFSMAGYLTTINFKRRTVIVATRSHSLLVIAHAEALEKSSWFKPLVDGMGEKDAGIWVPEDMFKPNQLSPTVTIQTTPQLLITAIRALYSGPNVKLDDDEFDFHPNESLAFVFTCRQFGIPRQLVYPWIPLKLIPP